MLDKDFILQSDLAAAEVCNIDAIIHDGDCYHIGKACDPRSADLIKNGLFPMGKVIRPEGLNWYFTNGVFSLGNPADLMETVIALLDDNGISICGHNGKYFLWDEPNQRHVNGDIYPDYTEAVRHAVMALEENKEGMTEQEKSLKLASLMGWETYVNTTIADHPKPMVNTGTPEWFELQPYKDTYWGLAQFAAILLKFTEVMNIQHTPYRQPDGNYIEPPLWCVKEPTQANILDVILRHLNGVEI